MKSKECVAPTFVQRIICIWFQEQVLKSCHDGIEVQYRLPVFSKDVEADIAVEVEIRMVNLRTGCSASSTYSIYQSGAHHLCTLDFWRLMGIVVVDFEREVVRAILVHAFETVQCRLCKHNLASRGQVHTHLRRE